MAERARRAWLYTRRISEAYGRHFGGLMAAAISFYALLSIIPLLSVCVSVVGLVIGDSSQALSQVTDVVQGYLPASGDVIYKTVAEVKRGSGLLGLIGLGGLLLSASAIFTNLEIALNNVWGVTVGRSWWKQRLVAVGTTVLTTTLLLSSIAITSAFTYIENAHLPGLDIRARQIPFLWQFLGHLVPLVLSVMTFALTYKIVPNKPIGWGEALRGGLFTGAAWELAKYVFALYLARFANYNKVYGSLGGLAILMVWAYYSMTIVLLGAEIAADHGSKLPAADGRPHNVPCPQPTPDG